MRGNAPTSRSAPKPYHAFIVCARGGAFAMYTYCTVPYTRIRRSRRTVRIGSQCVHSVLNASNNEFIHCIYIQWINSLLVAFGRLLRLHRVLSAYIYRHVYYIYNTYTYTYINKIPGAEFSISIQLWSTSAQKCDSREFYRLWLGPRMECVYCLFDCWVRMLANSANWNCSRDLCMHI